MKFILNILLYCVTAGIEEKAPKQEREEIRIVNQLFRMRNEHKADSAELYFADTVRVYMKYLRNVPRKMITQSDKSFWKSHPKNRFEITVPVQIKMLGGITIATITGKEYLDGSSYQFERIEIKFDRNKKIFSYRGIKLKK
ncbi:MAG: hypothetical protein WBC06_02105 [Chitinophagaceae bacterium]